MLLPCFTILILFLVISLTINLNMHLHPPPLTIHDTGYYNAHTRLISNTPVSCFSSVTGSSETACAFFVRFPYVDQCVIS